MNLKKIIELILVFVKSFFQCLQIKKPQHHFLSYKNDGFYLDGIKIIDQKATLQILVFKVILAQYADDILNNTSIYVSTKQIDKFLRKHNVCSDDYEAQIRQVVQRIRLSVKKKEKIEIIDSENWRGYKLNDSICIGKLW